MSWLDTHNAFVWMLRLIFSLIWSAH